jgi:hypothetical protein
MILSEVSLEDQTERDFCLPNDQAHLPGLPQELDGVRNQ